MGPIGQIVLSLVFGVITVSGTSLAWPRFTAAPRPQLLQQVHDLVIKTPAGQQSANVLGVSDEANIEPINMGEVAATVGNAVKSAIQMRASTIIMTQVTAQLTNRYNSLSKDQQETLQQIVCKPQASPSAVVK